jgi:hypothetical protein
LGQAFDPNPSVSRQAALVYQLRGEALLIVAVMHLKRHPDSWKSRVRPPER